jgi:hypothetical protein
LGETPVSENYVNKASFLKTKRLKQLYIDKAISLKEMWINSKDGTSIMETKSISNPARIGFPR